jgi:hypothetical protein
MTMPEEDEPTEDSRGLPEVAEDPDEKLDEPIE